MRQCLSQGCPALVAQSERYCARHVTAIEKARGTRTERGYDNRWLRASKRFLAENPLCVECKSRGVLRRATHTDHIVPHKGNETLFWSEANWQPLCRRCHSRKTATEDGGFGR